MVALKHAADSWTRRLAVMKPQSPDRGPRSGELGDAHISPPDLERRLGTPSPRASQDEASRITRAAGRGFGVRGQRLGRTRFYSAAQRPICEHDIGRERLPG